jgi:hypothetical protein
VELRADLPRQLARPRRIGVGDRDEIHRRILRGEASAQRPDAPRSDHGDSQRLALDHLAIPA